MTADDTGYRAPENEAIDADDDVLWELPEEDDDAVPTGFTTEDDCYMDLAIHDAVARELLQEDGFGHIGELWDRVIDDEPRQPERQVRELCLLCGWPLDLPRSYRECEFPYQPKTWWRDDRPAWCHCNGCLTAPRNHSGRPDKYCSDDCRHRMKLARERAQRRAEGAKSWSFDDEADRLADYEIAIQGLARNRTDHYPRW